MKTKTKTNGGALSADFGPCPNCPKIAPPTFQLSANKADDTKCKGCEKESSVNSKDGMPCHETARRAGPPCIGTAAHEIIQSHFKSVRPAGAREYLIPESGKNGGVGYADAVDLGNNGIFEIKFINDQAQGIAEAGKYVSMAKKNCSDAPWHLGTGFPAAEFPFPMVPNGTLHAKQYAPGSISYWITPKKQPDRIREPAPDRSPRPAPIPMPGREPEGSPVPGGTPDPGIITQIRDFVERVIEQSLDATEEAHKLLEDNPSLAWAVIVLGVVGIAAAIADDLTIVGIVDDVAIPVLAALIGVAWEHAW